MAGVLINICEMIQLPPEFVNKPRKVSFLKDLISILAALDYSSCLGQGR